MYYIGLFLGVLLATRLSSGLLLWVTKTWDGGMQRLCFVHVVSLISLGFLEGLNRNYGGDYVGIEAVGKYLILQFGWFLFDAIRSNRVDEKFNDDIANSDIDGMAQGKNGEYEAFLKHRAELIEKSQDGDANAQYELGVLYIIGLEIEKPYLYIEPDYNEALRWWRESGNQGDVRSQVNLAYVYSSSPTIKDKDEALLWWRMSALAGHSGAQHVLGAIHLEKAFKKNDRTKVTIEGQRSYVGGPEAIKELNESVKWYETAAKQGHEAAQLQLGDFFGYPDEKPQDTLKSEWWFRKAANQGNLSAQFRLASLYADGIGIKKSIAEATRWYFSAAEGGNVDSQKTLGHMYASGKILPKNYSEAAKWWRLVAIRERRERYVRVGTRFVRQPNYTAEALLWMCDAAADDLCLAQTMLEQLCIDAEKEKCNYLANININKPKYNNNASNNDWLDSSYIYNLNKNPEMMALLRELAEKNNPEAQLALWLVLCIPYHDEEIDAEALMWLSKSADQGMVLSQRIMGDLYLHGKCGAVHNELEAMKWYHLASDQGDIEAWYQLGGIAYSKVVDEWPQGQKYDSSGLRIWPEEYLEPVRWYLKAAEQGHAVAQHYLAELYSKGKGVKKDHKVALRWQKKAAAQGYALAQKTLAETYKRGMDFFVEGVPDDDAEALKWFNCASLQGIIATESLDTGAGSLKFAYFYGRGVSQDGAEAMNWHMTEKFNRDV